MNKTIINGIIIGFTLILVFGLAVKAQELALEEAALEDAEVAAVEQPADETQEAPSVSNQGSQTPAEQPNRELDPKEELLQNLDQELIQELRAEAASLGPIEFLLREAAKAKPAEIAN